MSVDCALYIGYTVNLKNDLSSDDFDFFNNFDGYNRWNCEGKVVLLVDGMNGDYARMIFVDKKINGIWECDDYYKLQYRNTPDEVYNELNKLYMSMYGKELNKELIEYAITVHFN